jgi:proteasome accessory factor B
VTIDRFERLTNLIAVLLATHRPLTLDEVTERVPGYPESLESRRRQFERDKETLRDLGVPIAMGPVDHLGGTGDLAYRILPSEYYLPELDLTPDERAALSAAVTAVHIHDGEGREALWKLGGGGDSGTPRLAALPSVEALPRLFEAYRGRAVASFAYRGEVRRVELWAIVFRRGHWYAIGHDQVRGAQRSFRADRIDGAVTLGAPGAFERPSDFDPSRALSDEPWRFGGDDALDALVLVDDSHAPTIVTQLGEAAVVERRDGGVVVRLAVTNRDAFRSFVLGFLDHAEVLAPQELRDDVVEWLRVRTVAHDGAGLEPTRPSGPGARAGARSSTASSG